MEKSPKINGNNIDFKSATFSQLKGLSSERLRLGLRKLTGKSKKIKKQAKLINSLLRGGTEVFCVMDARTKAKTVILRGSEAEKNFTIIHHSSFGDVEQNYPDDRFNEAVSDAKWIGQSNEV